MTSLAQLKRLLSHMKWADIQLLNQIHKLENGMKDEKLYNYIHHLHVVQRVFLKIWKNQSLRELFPKYETSDEFLNWMNNYHNELNEFIHEIKEDNLENLINVPWAIKAEKLIGYKAEPSTLRDTITQVILHSQYHRGQANARLREIGGEPPQVDYIAWIWMGKPGVIE